MMIKIHIMLLMIIVLTHDANNASVRIIYN